MSNRIIVIFSIYLAFITFSPSAQAAKLTPFSDKSSLQPIPAEIAPNISGNINSSLKAFEPQENAGNLSEEETSQTEQNSPNAAKTKNIYIRIAIGALAVSLIYNLIRKRRSDQDSKI